jgi:hypothetical protein
MYSKLLAGTVTLLVLGLPVPLPAQGSQQSVEQVTQANRQHEPHMAAALEHLRQAQQELERATPNKGGHRQKAIDLTKQAESQVEQGIQYYDQHVSPGPKKEKPKK